MVSPLIRIHNETTFSMALCFQRPQQVETEFASVLLKTGDTIDDSMAAFDSINVSGGLKKALLSLSVGMCGNLNCILELNLNFVTFFLVLSLIPFQAFLVLVVI